MKFNEAIEKLSQEARDQIKDCKSSEDILDIFSKNGLQLTKQDIEDAIKSRSGELSDDELSTVTGGIDPYTIIQDLFKMGFKELQKQLDKDKK